MLFRTHLTKQDSKELRVGKERVSSLDYRHDYADNAHDDDADDDDAEDDDDDDTGEGGGAGGGCGVRLPLCGHLSKALQRTF